MLRLDARALALGYRHGSDTLLVLLDLASRAVDSHEGTVVAASYRDIARRLGISKDTVGRRMQVLRRSGVVVEQPGRCDRFGVRSYLLAPGAGGRDARAGARRRMTVRARDADRDEPEPVSTVLLSAESRTLRRRLRPLVWMALEEVALDAVAEDGRLVARTSARQVAELLQVDPGSAARALRVLREHGLVVLEREKGPDGRFGLSVYVLGTIAGLTVLGPVAVEPRSALPSLDEADRDKPHTAAAGAEKPCADGAYGVAPATALAPLAAEPAATYAGRRSLRLRCHFRPTALRTAARLSVPAMQIPGQGTLDLDGDVA